MGIVGVGVLLQFWVPSRFRRDEVLVCNSLANTATILLIPTLVLGVLSLIVAKSRYQRRCALLACAGVFMGFTLLLFAPMLVHN